MAGVDHKECEINLEALDGSLEQPQPHLLAEPQETEQNSSAQVDDIHTANLSLELGTEWVKIKIREWAKAVASNNEKKANLRLKEIALLMDDHIMPAK